MICLYMFDFVRYNLDKICIGIGTFFLLEIGQKYYNLKYYNRYNNYEIKNEKVYHIEQYKKELYKPKYVNPRLKFYSPILNQNYNLFNKLYDIQFLNSISIIINENNYNVFYNKKFLNPKIYLYYNNDDIFRTIVSDLALKKDCKIFFDNIAKYKNDSNIKYKIIQSEKSFCAYNNLNLITLSDSKDDIIKNILENDIAFMSVFFIIGIFFYKLNKQ